MAASKASFTVADVVGGGSLVSGTDVNGASGSVILHDPAWTAYVESQLHSVALDEYNAAVKEFFAPLVEASEALKSDDKKDWATITVTESVEGKRGQGIRLGHDGVILRILSETDGSSLRWVNDSLIALEV